MDVPRWTLDRASSVLVTASGPDSKGTFERFVLPRVADANLAAVLYERPGTTFVEEVATNRDGCPNDVRVLDVGETVRSTSAAQHQEPSATAIVGNVEQVDDLTTIERELERFLEQWKPSGRSTVVYVDSLTPLLRAVDAPLVGDFLARITRTLGRYDALGVIRLPTAEHEASIVEGLCHRVDACIDFAGDGGDRVDGSDRRGDRVDGDGSSGDGDDRTGGNSDDGECVVVDPGAANWLAATAGPDRLSIDCALDVLRTPERQGVLSYLSTTQSATLEDLAVYLADRSDVAETDPEQIQVALYQVHIPKLLQAGAVENVDGRYRIDTQSGGKSLLPLLDVVDAWSRR